jgi:Uma2 family endonuclease
MSTQSIQDRLLDPSPEPAETGLSPPLRMTEEEFVAWCDEDTRAEWVDGEVIIMSPANLEHCGLSDWLVRVLGTFVEEHDSGIVLSEAQMRFARLRRRRVPDLWFLAESRRHLLRESHVEGPPDLVIEIVSPDSLARDWREKYLEYQAAGVREYWVIDPMARHVEAYALEASPPSEAAEPAPAQYRRLEEREGIIASTVLSGFRLRTAWLWPATRPKAMAALEEMKSLAAKA